MTIRYYASTAQPTTLALNATPASTTIEVVALVGYPSSFPYTLCLDFDTGLRELVDATNAAGTTLTVTRAVDGTSAVAHSAGSTVRHVSSARDYADSRAHENAASGVHGIAGTLVGETDVQTLTNKTLTAPVINNPTITGLTATGGTLTSTNLVTPIVTNPAVTGGTFTTPAIDDPTLRDVTITSSTNADVSLKLNALPAQSGNIVEVTDDSGFKRITIDRDGTLATFTGDSAIGLVAKLDPAATNNDAQAIAVRDKLNSTKLVVRGNGQLASFVAEDKFMIDLQRPATVPSDAIAYRRAGVFLWGVDDAGNMYANNITVGAWTNFTPTWTTSGTAPALGNGLISGAWTRVGRQFHVRYVFQAGTTTTFGTGEWRFSMPAGFTMAATNGYAGTAIANDVGGNTHVGAIFAQTGGNYFTFSGPVTAGPWSNTIPFTWANADNITASITVQIA